LILPGLTPPDPLRRSLSFHETSQDFRRSGRARRSGLSSAYSETHYNEIVADATRALQSQFRELGDTWQDQEQAKFSDEFDQTVRVISQFQETTKEHIPVLLEKAKHTDSFLRR
jgi:uncharacterized protein YukE